MAVPNKSFQPKPGGFRPNTGGGFNKGGFNRNRFAPRKEAEHRINHFIRVPQVRLVGDNVEPGIYQTNEAIKKAQAAGGKVVTPRTPIPGMGAYGRIADSEGNVIGLFEGAQ